MASSSMLSKFIEKGQTALGCQLCENEPKIKWKCLDCKILMCQRCKEKVHPKFHAAENHNIIDIKDVGKHEQEKKPDFTKLKCAQHKGQNCCLFCKTCVELVCPLCIANIHKKHDLVELEEGYQIQVDKIRNVQSLIQGGIKIQASHKEKLNQIKQLHQSRYDRMKQEILDQNNALVIAVKKQTNKLLNELDIKWKETSKSLYSENRHVDKNQKKLLEQNDEVNNMIQYDDVQKIFNMSDSQLKSMGTNTKLVSTTFYQLPKFVPGKISENSFQFGTLENVTDPYSTDLKVLKRYNTRLNEIFKIHSYQSGFHYISDLAGNVQKVELIGDTVQVLFELKIKVADMALNSSGDLLVSVESSSTIKIIPSGTQEFKDSVYNISPLITTGIHVTHDSKFIVGAVYTGSEWPATGPRQVIVMDQTGKPEKVFQYDKDKPLFTMPARITSNRRNHIGVVDWISNDLNGRVVILDQGGGLKNIYNGHPNVDTADNPFRPCSIVSTKSDNFVVCDTWNDTIHILNSDGNFISYHNTVEMGVELPMSLSMGYTGLLYIGCIVPKNDKNSDEGGDKACMYEIDNFLW